MSHQSNVLYIDMDGTLLKGDTLVEGLWALLRSNPLVILLLPVWLTYGRARLKHEVGLRTSLDVDTLPVNRDFVSFLEEEAGKGRTIRMATGANEIVARKVAARFPFISECIASDKDINLTSSAKLEQIQRSVSAFDYAGNSTADITLMEKSAESIAVRPTLFLRLRMGLTTNLVDRTFDEKMQTRSWKWIRLIRLHQWSKNVLVAVPLIVSQSFDIVSLQLVVIGFIALCLLASATYIANDFFDLSADRHHSSKHKRPLACGEVSLFSGALVMLALFIASGIVTSVLPPQCQIALLIYLLTTLSYSALFKRVLLLDVIVLAFLYTLRVIIGARVISVEPSIWLLAFSMFIFFSLALVKRYSELFSYSGDHAVNIPGRGYKAVDQSILATMGVSSGFVSVLVVALYINESASTASYQRPEFLWGVCPILLYWIGSMWIRTARGEMHEDPIAYALSDVASIVSAILLIILFAGAVYAS